MAPRLVPDSLAAMNAVNAELGIPVGGVVGLLDFGGSGTYVTLMDTGIGLRTRQRHTALPDFSGEEIDQALLLHVFEQSAAPRTSTRPAPPGSVNSVSSKTNAGRPRSGYPLT